MRGRARIYNDGLTKQARFRERLKAAGRCRACTEPMSPQERANGLMCDVCKQDERARCRERRERMKGQPQEVGCSR